MNSLTLKLDPALQRRLDQIDDDTRLSVEIVPIQNRWLGLLRNLREAVAVGVEYNVVDLTSITATLPKALIAGIAERPDVVSVRLGEDDR